MEQGNLGALKLRIMAAQSEYDEASQAFDELREQIALHPELLYGSEESQAIRSAKEREHSAYRNYQAALQKYSDFMLGKPR